MSEFWTIPIDRIGLVIYFGVNGRPFLFNGHKGVFYDSLPPHAVEMLDGLSNPEEDQPARVGTGSPLVTSHGRACAEPVAAGERDGRAMGRNRTARNGLRKEIQLYQSGAHPDLLPETRQGSFFHKLDPKRVVIYVSQACNLACAYCLNQGGTFGTHPSLMSVETAKDAVAFIRKTVATATYPFVTVNLFGGEPLLSRKAAYTLARGLQDLNRENLRTKVHIMLSTNGTIYDQEIFEILAEAPECNTVVVTLDAFKGAHDKNRPFRDPSRGSSYDTVVANLRRMMASKIPYSVSCQVPYPYDYVGAAEELHNLGVELLEIRPLFRHIFGRQGLPEVFRDDLELWKEKYLAYSDYYVDYLGAPPASKHLDRLAVFGEYEKALSRHGEARRTLACGPADDVIGVASDGRALPCQCFLQEGLEIGHVKTGIDAAKRDRFEEWLLAHGQLRIDNERCRNCYAKLLCGGGCYAQSYDRAARLEPLPESSCRFIREKLKIDLYYISRMRKEHPELVPRFTDASS